MEALFNSLTEIESELKDLSSRQKKNWQRIVFLLITVQRDGLFQKSHSNFSEWLRAFAAEVGLHEATFWRYYTSGSYYLEKTGETVDQIEKVNVSPRKLEIVRRIEEHASVLGEELFKRVVSDDPNVTMSLLNKTWERIRDGRTQDEAKVLELQPTIEHLIEEFNQLSDQSKLSLFRSVLESIAAKGRRDILDRAIVQFRQTQSEHSRF